MTHATLTQVVPPEQYFHALRGMTVCGLNGSTKRGFLVSYHLLALLVDANTETFQNSKSSNLFEVFCFKTIKRLQLVVLGCLLIL